MRPDDHTRLDLGLALLLTAAHLALRLATQPNISAGWGLGWDGVYYYLMAAGTDPPGHHYAERIAIPFLARHFFFSDLRLNFLIINLLFGALFSVLSFLLIARVKPDLSPLTKITAWCLLCATEVSPIPETAWYPVQTDAAANTFLIAFLYALLSGVQSPLVYFAIFLGGMLVRENFATFAAFVLIVVQLAPPSRPYRDWLVGSLRTNRGPLLILAGVVAGAVVGFALLLFLAPYNPFQYKARLFVRWVARHDLVSVLTGLVCVFGPAGFFYLLYRAQSLDTRPAARVATADDRKATDEARVRNPFRGRGVGVAVALLVLFVVSLGGGTNRERYFFWGLPVAAVAVTPYIDALVRGRRYAAWALGFAFMLLFQRALVPIEAGGMGGCDVWSFVTGGTTWLGHWTQQCPRAAAIRLLTAYLGLCAAVVLAATVSGRLRMAPARQSEEPAP